MAHIDAGKTTVTERILFFSGRSHKMGEVHDGAATTDYMEQERERGITITSAATACEWNHHRINIIDTPGHVDFTAEVERSLRVLDGAIAVFDAVAGVQPQSETVWRQADKYSVPRMALINKMDRIGADFNKAVQSMRDRLGATAVTIQIPLGVEDSFHGVLDPVHERVVRWIEQEDGKPCDQVIEEVPADLVDQCEEARQHIIEAVADHDEKLMEAYLNEEDITTEDLKAAIRRATLASSICPVVCGTALKNKGVRLTLDAVIDYLPCPLDIGEVEGFHPDDPEKKMHRRPADDETFTAMAFKIITDPHVGRLTFVRVYSGELHAGAQVLNVRTGKKERLGRLLEMHADQRMDLKVMRAGDIGAVIGAKDTTTGDTLCDPNRPIALMSLTFPEPVVQIAIEPKTKADQDKMSEALQKLSDEDPTFRVKVDDETGQTIIAGMGELHLDIIVDRMKREFKVEANIGRPQVAYRESIQRECKGVGKFIRQSGGRGQYGHVVVSMEPGEPGSGFTFENKSVGGVVPRDYWNAVEKGAKETVTSGVISGYPMVDVKVCLLDGSYHEVDSSEMAFHTAASMAVKDAAPKGGPVLLEPLMEIEVTCPEEFTGDVIGDFNSRRGRLEGMDQVGMIKTVRALVPLAEMFGYANDLRSKTQGRASFSMEFERYEAMPANVANAIMESTGSTYRFGG